MSRALAGGILGDFYFLPQAFVKYMDVFFMKNIFIKSNVHDKYDKHGCMLCTKFVTRVNSKSSHQKERYFFYLFNFLSIGDNG